MRYSSYEVKLIAAGLCGRRIGIRSRLSSPGSIGQRPSPVADKGKPQGGRRRFSTWFFWGPPTRSLGRRDRAAWQRRPGGPITRRAICGPVVLGCINRRMPRMQVYLPDELYEQVKARGLPASELLQRAVRAELHRLDLLGKTDRYVAELVAEVGAPTREQTARARLVAARLARPARKAG